jgi:D-arabinitol dehydrogenase (NADP+)
VRDLPFCQTGRPASCENSRSQGHNLQGGFAQYILCSGEKTYPFADTISFDSASFCELINCALSAVDRAELKYGESVVIIGCGTSGNLLAQLFRHSCAGRVVVLDSMPSKLEKSQGPGSGNAVG